MCWITFSALSRKPRRTSLTEFSLSPSHTEFSHTHTHNHGPRIVPLPVERSTRKHVRFALLPRDSVRRHEPLRGHGVKRAPPPAPPPSPSSPRNRGAEWAPRDEGRVYRTVVAVPERSRGGGERFAVRAATNRRLEEIRIEAFRPSETRRRLRRVAGYDVLSSRVPWGWDCVEEPRRRRSRDRGYPPFGPAESWM